MQPYALKNFIRIFFQVIDNEFFLDRRVEQEKSSFTLLQIKSEKGAAQKVEFSTFGCPFKD